MDNGEIKGGKGPNTVSTWWANRTNKQRKWIKVVVTAAAILLLGLILFFFFYEKRQICMSPGCIREAEDIMNYIDMQVDPCDDFYKFTCGRFLKETSLDRGTRSVKNVTYDEIQQQIKMLLEEPIVSDDPKSFNQAKKFYSTCMNESAVDARNLSDILEILDRIGGWPTLKEEWDEDSNWDWKAAVHVLRISGIDFDLFFGVKVEVDEENPLKHIVAIYHPVYRASQITPNVKNMYLDYMIDVALKFGATKDVAKRDLEEVLNFLLNLGRISQEANVSNEPPVRLPLSELERIIYKFGWVQYLDNVLRTVFVYEHDVIKVSSMKYLRKLVYLLRTTPKRTLSNLISWQTLQYLINYLPSRILESAYEYLRKVNGSKVVVKQPRWNICVKATEDRMYSVIAAAYIEHFFDYDIVGTRVLRLIHDIKHQIKKNFKQVDWLDEESKRKSLEALNSGTEEIISIQELLQTLEENRIYDDVYIRGDMLLKSALNLTKEQLDHGYRKLREEVSENWLTKRGFLMSLDVIYLPKENVLKFPNGLFQGAYYRPDRPEYINYGGLGSVAAHEISHIFMDSEAGDIYGRNIRSWWSITSMQRYSDKLKCLSEQYSHFYLPGTHTPLKPERTCDEDIADLAGMKVAYDAYVNLERKKGKEAGLPDMPFTPRQLFWISAARHHCTKYSPESLKRLVEYGEHSPEQFRVNGPLQNIDEFSHDFQCRLGTKMNPDKKCYIW